MNQYTDVDPRACVLDLPVELAHHILGLLLDIEDVFALRKTCKYFHTITRDRAVWSALYNRMRTSQPLPCSRIEFELISYPQFERVLVAAAKTEKTFLLRRQRTHFVPHEAARWQLLSFITDRFLLSADSTTVIILWDISNLSSSMFPYATISVQGWRFSTYAVSADRSTISVVVCLTGRAQIYSAKIPLDTTSPDAQELSSFVFVTEFEMAGGKLVKYINPERSLALITHEPRTASFDVFNWCTNKRSIIPLAITKGKEAPYAIEALRICGPYVLCIRANLIDAYPLPAEYLDQKYVDTKSSLPVLQKGPFSLTYTSASFSDVRLGRCSGGETYTVYVLTCQKTPGPFHCQIVLTVTQNPSLIVRILGMKGWGSYGIVPVLSPRREVGTLVGPPYALGFAGLRGIWIERPIASWSRNVFAFTTHPSILHADESLDNLPRPVPPLERKKVAIATVAGADEDADICAVSELTGRIALGLRDGGISIFSSR